MTKHLTVGSLFSGIGGIDLGLERAGMRVVWQVEKDEYARRVLAKNFLDVPCYDDVRELCGRRCDPTDCAHPEYVDVLAGGFPCQDISVAGKGKGLKGERSGLWSEFARIIRELRPRYLLVENVPALRSRGLDCVLGDLAASGYDAEWDCFPASAFGAPHRRDRLFIVAHAQREQLREQPGGSSGPNGEDSIFPAGDGEEGFTAHAARIAEREPSTQTNTIPNGGNARAISGCDGWRSLESPVCGMAHGVPARVDRLRCLGNAVVPQVAEFIGRLIVAHAERNP